MKLTFEESVSHLAQGAKIDIVDGTLYYDGFDIDKLTIQRLGDEGWIRSTNGRVAFITDEGKKSFSKHEDELGDGKLTPPKEVK